MRQKQNNSYIFLFTTFMLSIRQDILIFFTSIFFKEIFFDETFFMIIIFLRKSFKLIFFVDQNYLVLLIKALLTYFFLSICPI